MTDTKQLIAALKAIAREAKRQKPNPDTIYEIATLAVAFAEENSQ